MEKEDNKWKIVQINILQVVEVAIEEKVLFFSSEVECLPFKQEVLGLISNTRKQKGKPKKYD